MRRRRIDSAVEWGMILPLRISEHWYPVKMRWFLGAAWLVILAKCMLVWWVIERWHVPIHPAWVIVPTLAMAALATSLWLGHPDD